MLEDVVLVAKATIAVVLLAAGGAKLADIPSFTEAVKLFAPTSLRASRLRWIAIIVATSEVMLGEASLSIPKAHMLNFGVIGMSSGFLLITAIGYTFHRGHACRCFGALSRRQFDRRGLLRSVGLVCLAIVAATSPSKPDVDIAPSASILLAVAGALLAGVAFAAAKSLSTGRRYGLATP